SLGHLFPLVKRILPKGPLPYLRELCIQLPAWWAEGIRLSRRQSGAAPVERVARICNCRPNLQEGYRRSSDFSRICGACCVVLSRSSGANRSRHVHLEPFGAAGNVLLLGRLSLFRDAAGALDRVLR